MIALNILITGSSGMIGSRLVRDLSFIDGVNVFAVDVVSPKKKISGVQYLISDVRDKKLIEKLSLLAVKVDYIVHLAARTDLKGNNIYDYEFNFMSIFNVQNIVDRFDVDGVVVVSTQLIKDIGRDYDAPPTTFYGQSKLLLEKLSSEVLTCNYCILRPTTVWGPEHSDHYRQFIRILQKGLYFHPTFKEVFKSYSYVGNISFQIYKLVKSLHCIEPGKVYYGCDYNVIGIRDHVNRICDQLDIRRPKTLPLFASKVLASLCDLINKLGINIPFGHFRLENITTSYIYDNADLYELTGELPYSYEKALNEYRHWIHSDSERSAKRK